MKFLSKLMMLFLLSSCSYLDNTPEVLDGGVFPAEWRGYYQLESNTDFLYYLKSEFKVSTNYITLENYSSSSTGYNEEDRFSTYQIYYGHTDEDSIFHFTVCKAYQKQDIPYGEFVFKSNGEDEVIVYYYYSVGGGQHEYATYKKTPL